MIGALSVGASALQAPPPTPAPVPAGAPAPAAPAPAAPAAKVAEIEKVKDNLYILKGGGGNTAAFITEKGVVVVDTKLAGWGQAILDKIKTVTDKPVSTIINTHTHGDHIGSNEFFGAKVETVVQENTKANMEKMDAFKGDKAPVPAREDLQGQDVPRQRQGEDRPLLLRSRPHQRRYLRGVPRAQGDARGRHVRRQGHAASSTPATGAAASQYSKTLAKAVSALKRGRDGHPRPRPLHDLERLQGVRRLPQGPVRLDQGQQKAGKTPEEAADAFQVPEKYQGYTVRREGFGAFKGTVQCYYDELGGKKS